MKNSSYYIAPVGDRTHDLPHTVASNMVKVSHALNHSATEACYSQCVPGYTARESGVWCPQHRTARYARRAIVNVSQDILLGRAVFGVHSIELHGTQGML